ncbi:TonB-dependent receptor [Sinimarinibacterium thermocellulolyticum]|uniref:TonB-dependent receptor n=1 Tax=Sinimarinibacterium thermocellulolyticum TaxID=3170016 RepID=A0ABV2A697_9GAMM
MNVSIFRALRARPALAIPALQRSLLASTLAMATAPTLAQDQDATRLDDVIVTASPLGRTADELIQPVTVIGSAELDRRRANNLGETLEHEPGVAATDFGRGAGRPVIRGLAGPRVEILDNGLSTMDVSDLSPDHAVSIDPAHARRIEILKGPSTLLYGNAASGVVNVVDDRLPDAAEPGFGGGIDLEYGDNGNARRTHTEFDYGSGPHLLHADYAWRDIEDYEIPGTGDVDGEGVRGVLPNSAVESRNGALSYNWFGRRGDVFGLSYSRFDSRYGLPFAHGHHEHHEEDGEAHTDEAHTDEAPVGFIDLEQNRFDTRILLDRPLRGLESLRIRAGYSDYTHTEFEAPGEPGTVFENEQVQARIEATHVAVAGLRGTVGVQLNDRDFEAIGEEAYVPPVRSRSIGLFVLEERALGFGRLEFGARVDRNRTEPDQGRVRSFTPLSLAAGAIVDVGEHGHVKLYLTQAERSPVQEELYAFGPHLATATFERGSADLDIERFHNAELGFDWHAARLRLDASVYFNRVSDYIFLAEVDRNLNADGSGTGVPDGVADRVDEEGVFAADGELLLVDYRQADARLHGYEIELAYALVQGPLQVDIGAFTDSVRARLDDGGDLPRITPRRYGLMIAATGERVGASLRYTHVARQDRVAALETPTAGHDLLNAYVSARVFGAADRGPRVDAYLRADNLLDEDVRRATSFVKDLVPAPGRSLYAGLCYRF